jgi:two-component system, NarL family, sensor histidine kinase UhpB
LRSVEALQQANRRVLDRLRPLYIQELGLENSVQTLLQDAKAQAPNLEVTWRLDPALNEAEGLLSLTVYRVIQEAMTNVLRHSRASAVHVVAEISGSDVNVEISDDGIGFPADRRFGRGLTGMLERARALSGTFELLREGGRTSVRCRLPVDGGASNGPATSA